MPITLGSNIASLMAQRKVGDVTASLSRTFERLSSGQRINKASDDAAGLAIASSLDTYSRIVTMGVRNANDVISAFSIADSAVQNLSGITTRMEELTIQAMNGIYSQTQRKALDAEAQALRLEYNRIAQSTQFNDIRILTGGFANFSAQVGASRIDMSLSLSGSPTLLGTGEFGPEINGDCERATAGVAFGDIDGDGDQDMVGAHSSTNQVLSYLNDGTGDLDVEQTIGGVTSAVNVALADVDGDNDVDLIYAFDDRIGVRMNTGGTFGAATDTVVGDEAAGLVISDFNNDGRPDIAVQSNGDDQLQILTNNGSGVFSISQTISSAGTSLTMNDFNADGYEDLVTNQGGTNQGDIFLGQAGGTFSGPTGFTLGGVSSAIYNQHQQLISGDFTGDGRADIIFGRAGSGTAWDVFIKAGDGSGGFGAEVQLFENASQGLAAGDVDKDGDLDFATAEGTFGGATGVYLNNGFGNFAYQALSPLATQSITTGIVDMNGDGVPDIVYANAAGGGSTGTSVFIQESFLNSRDFSFFPTLTLLSAEGRTQALADITAVREALSMTLGKIGAYQSRLFASINNNLVKSENYKAAGARIMDADIAEESSRLVRLNILQQAASSILAQANQQPTVALQLVST